MILPNKEPDLPGTTRYPEVTTYIGAILSQGILEIGFLWHTCKTIHPWLRVTVFTLEVTR
jgi:hypothetical protein